jgi:hypothetical protein
MHPAYPNLFLSVSHAPNEYTVPYLNPQNCCCLSVSYKHFMTPVVVSCHSVPPNISTWPCCELVTYSHTSVMKLGVRSFVSRYILEKYKTFIKIIWRLLKSVLWQDDSRLFNLSSESCTVTCYKDIQWQHEWFYSLYYLILRNPKMHQSRRRSFS